MMSHVLSAEAVTADSGPHVIDCRWPEKMPALVSATDQPDTLDGPVRQLALFVGGSKDGQTIVVPFEDGALCVCVEMQPQVVLRRQLQEKRSLKLPVRMENYVQRTVAQNNKRSQRFAISLHLELTHYCKQIKLLEDQMAAEAVQTLRGAIRAQVASIGGRILPAAIGCEDIFIELIASEDCTTRPKYKGTLRGECWVVTPRLTDLNRIPSAK